MLTSFFAAFYIILLSVSLVGIILLFAAKGKTTSIIITFVMGFLDVSLAFFSYQNAADAISPDYAGIFAICVGLLAILGVIARLLLRKGMLPQILITLSFCGSFWGCGAIKSILSLF